MKKHRHLHAWAALNRMLRSTSSSSQASIAQGWLQRASLRIGSVPMTRAEQIHRLGKMLML